MKHVIKFNEFLSEKWNYTQHWVDRTDFEQDIDNLKRRIKPDKKGNYDFLSRIVPKSNDFKSGWECKSMLCSNPDGKLTGEKINLTEVLGKNNVTRAEFNDKVTQSLYLLANNDRTKNKFYFDRDIHRYVFLGKLIMKFGEEYFSPVLEVVDTHTNEKHIGNCMWGDIKEQNGITILYFKENVNRDEIEKLACKERNRLNQLSNLADEDYVRHVKLDYLSDKNFSIVVPDSPEWKSIVKKQADSGEMLIIKKDYSKDPDAKDWDLLFKSNSEIVFDNGTELYLGNGKFRTVRFRIPTSDILKIFKDKGEVEFYITEGDKIVGTRILKKDTIISVVSQKSKIEKEAGHFSGSVLDADTKIIKKIKVFSLIDRDKLTIKGAVKEIFAVLDGTEVYSKFPFPS